jgi:hypothetical protein
MTAGLLQPPCRERYHGAYRCVEGAQHPQPQLLMRPVLLHRHPSRNSEPSHPSPTQPPKGQKAEAKQRPPVNSMVRPFKNSDLQSIVWCGLFFLKSEGGVGFVGSTVKLTDKLQCNPLTASSCWFFLRITTEIGVVFTPRSVEFLLPQVLRVLKLVWMRPLNSNREMRSRCHARDSAEVTEFAKVFFPS